MKLLKSKGVFYDYSIFISVKNRVVLDPLLTKKLKLKHTREESSCCLLI